MLRLQPDLTGVLRDSADGFVDEEPVNEEVLARVKDAASRSFLLTRIASLANAILEEQGFVQVRGFPVCAARPLFLAFAGLMGKIYIDQPIGTAIVHAEVRPGESLMGNQLRRLPLHTDYSMLEQPPRLTMSYCVRPDAVGGYGAVSVADIEAECYGTETSTEIKLLKEVHLPFAARNSGQDVDVIDRPILSLHPEKNKLLVRYHRSRIVQGFRYRGTEPTMEQMSAMRQFELLAGGAAQTLQPESGDIIVIDNHRTVHGRERCSVEVIADGTTMGRQMMFVFAY